MRSPHIRRAASLVWIVSENCAEIPIERIEGASLVDVVRENSLDHKKKTIANASISLSPEI